MESNVARSKAEEVHAHCSSLVFPLRLYKFLHETEEYQLSHIASFQSDGRSFRIHNRIEFVTATLRWFSFSKYESFQRQLNIYGFKRVLGGTDKGCYYHKNFIRGQYHLAQSIKRIPVKKMMIASSKNHTSVAGVGGVTTGTSIWGSPMTTSTNNQHIQANMIHRQSGEISSHQSIMATNFTIPPNLLRGTAPHISSDQYEDVNKSINRHLRDTLTNSASTQRASIGSSSIPLLQTQPNIRGTNASGVYDTDATTLSVLQQLQNASNQPITTLPSSSLQQTSILLQFLHERATNDLSSIPLLQTQPNIHGTNAPLNYDTDASTLSVLQRLRNASNPLVTHSHIPVSLPTATLESIPRQQTSILSQSLQELVNALTNHVRLQSHELTNRTRMQTLTDMDRSALLLHSGAHSARGQNQIHLSQSDAPFGVMPIHPTSSVNDAAVRDILLQQQNESNRRALDEQTIRHAIMLLQQQLPPNSSATDNE